ncbi:YncE family protein [Pseudonocardia sp. GCM10023141]|uniref:YncE family protein n=1 Tax=Pseudonocardia sp. GCM10023141 TaxID=3252653 RepID=UPI00361D782E
MRRRSWLILATVVVATVVVATAGAAALVMSGIGSTLPPRVALPQRIIAQVPLPGDGSRFDYASSDDQRGLLFIAHLGASEVIEVDLATHQVLRTIANLAQVHGVLVVPALHRVYATATGTNEVVGLDEDTGQVVTRSPTGDYPDGLAYDPRRNTVWTTNETGGTETVIDATTGAPRGTVDLGGEVGNVAYDPTGDRMWVAVQGRGDLAELDPTTLAVTRRAPLPGCDHPHGLALDPAKRLGFLACDANATLLTVDLATGQTIGSDLVGPQPDVLAYDPGAHRLHVAAESGWVSLLELHDRRLSVVGSDHLADGAHVVAVDELTHHSFYPLPAGADGHPALLEAEPLS